MTHPVLIGSLFCLAAYASLLLKLVWRERSAERIQTNESLEREPVAPRRAA